MTESERRLPRSGYGVFVFWGIHTLMLALFLILEAVGFKMPVGSSIFYFAWIALWIMHGLALLLGRVREREAAAGDAAAGSRYWRRMVLGGHSALYIAFGPAVMLWWLTARSSGPQQPGEGQGLWIYPVWLVVLLFHSAYVMHKERQTQAASYPQKRKRQLPDLKRLMQADGEAFEIVDDDDSYQENQR